MGRSFFVAVIGGFFLGVVLRSITDFGLEFVWFALLLGAALGISQYAHTRYYSHTTRAYIQTLLVALFFVSLSLGVLRTHTTIARALDPLLTTRIGDQVNAVGLVVAEPDERESSTRLTLTLHELIDENGVRLPVHGRALVVVAAYPKLNYGDWLTIEGQLQSPQAFVAENGRVFDYPRYLAKESIHFEIKRAKISLVSSGDGNTLLGGLLSLKNSFLESIGRLVPEPHASLLGGLLLGAQRSLGEDLLARFRAVGLIHVIVLSGYNISIVADALMRLTKRFLPRRMAFFLGVISIVLFALMTGGSATVVRASVMALIALLARATDRVYDMTRALIFAGTAMALHNPLIVVFDPSFQLSFLATLALILLAPRLAPRLSFVPERFKLREVATATIATQIFVLPLLLFLSGELSVVALPTNLLVLIAVPATMLFGFLAGSIGLVSIALASPLAWVATALLGYILAVVNMFSLLPFASVALPPLPLWGLVAAYALLCLALAWLISQTQPPHAPKK